MKTIKYWVIKIFFITLVISAGVSVAAEYFISRVTLPAAVAILAGLIALGVFADVVGVAFASCDPKPFTAMSAKGDKKAHYALRLLKNADVVSNFCNDVIGDICGIVSGAAGAAITLKALVFNAGMPEIAVSIAISALIAASTVSAKAAGKNIAFKNNKRIVLAVGAAAHFFSVRNGRRDGRDEKEN
jgi:CBS domain containing-hemolysin-like protein